MFFIIDTNVDSADDGKIKRSAEQGISYIYFKTCCKVHVHYSSHVFYINIKNVSRESS